MTLKLRFTLVGIGVVLFIIVTPFLVLFARGFKIDWDNRQIVKTGTLIAKTQPEGASVFLNNELQKKETHYTGRFLLPGDYIVRIEKEGYQSWTKRLSILPQLVTWANSDRPFLALFYTKPETINDIKTTNVSLSENSRQLVYSQDDQLFFIETNDDNTRLLGKALAAASPFNFTDKLQWTDAQGVYGRFSNFGQTVLSPAQINGIERIESNADYTLVRLGGQLYRYDNNLSLIDTQISAFTLEGENVWYVQGQRIKNHNLRSGETSIIQEQLLPPYAAAQIIRGDGNLFIILDADLYNVGERLEKIYEGVAGAYWDERSNYLLFHNNNEILLYLPDRKNFELIMRSISPVGSPVLNWETGYIFFENEGKIKAIELDGRDHRNIYTILELDQGIENSFAVSENGKLLYVYSGSQIKTYRIR